MAISAIPGAGHQVNAARAAYAVAAVSRRATPPSAPELPATTSASSVRISDGAELLWKLRQLHDTQPKAFKRLMGELAEAVQAEVQNAGSARSTQLSTLADRFAEAAREGNITPLVPAIESGRARAQHLREQDVLVAPNESVRELFRGFVARVNAVLPAGTRNQASQRTG